MKMILLSVAFCALISTSRGQSAHLPNKTEKDGGTDVMDTKKDIASNIFDCKFSEIFSKALKETDLVETFNNKGPLTVFLPPDSAFNKLPAGKLDSLLRPENKYNLISLLTYHVLPGEISTKDIAKHIRRANGRASLHTIAGAWLMAEFDATGNIVLTDEKGGKSHLLKSNVKQRNGMIHLISSVLSPGVQPM